MSPASKPTVVEVEGRRLRLSNLDKVLYPATGFAKRDVIRWYRDVAPVILPHLRGRPLSMKRYPDGVGGGSFYEKHCPGHRPDWVRTAEVAGRRGAEPVDHCLVEDVPTLVWVANLASLELHVTMARADDVQRPTAVVFDLDPGAPAGLAECVRVAHRLREVLDRLGLQAFVKSSGGKGLHVYVPLHTPVTYEDTGPFARTVAELLAGRHPDAVVSNMRKDLRAGRVLVDWSQNSAHKSTACVYSLRARGRPTVSTPVTWDELDDVAAGRAEPDALVSDVDAARERLDRHGDLFRPVLELEQELPDLEPVRA